LKNVIWVFSNNFSPSILCWVRKIKFNEVVIFVAYSALEVKEGANVGDVFLERKSNE
jgi:hypothetical protein